jgi:hypothetical protein
VDVTKVVGIVARIPKHFSLHFSDFSTILYGIYKIAVFEFMAFLRLAPWTSVSSQRGSLVG